MTKGDDAGASRASKAVGMTTAALLHVASVSYCSPAESAERPCEAEMARASRSRDVPLAVLYAVALTETGQRGALHPYAMNIEGRPLFNATLNEALSAFDAARGRGARLIDIGCMQINHHYHGARFASVEEMFDPARNVDYAAGFLRKLHGAVGSWTAAVARYHAGPGNVPAQRTYVCAVIGNMVASGFGGWTRQAETFCGR